MILSLAYFMIGVHIALLDMLQHPEATCLTLVENILLSTDLLQLNQSPEAKAMRDYKHHHDNSHNLHLISSQFS